MTKKQTPPATPGETFVAEVLDRYDLSTHEQRLIMLAGQALDRAVLADAELRRHIEETGTVILNGKAHPASVIARDSARAFELLTRAADLPEEAVPDQSVRRLREVNA
jgi:hypothetical protein